MKEKLVLLLLCFLMLATSCQKIDDFPQSTDPTIKGTIISRKELFSKEGMQKRVEKAQRVLKKLGNNILKNNTTSEKYGFSISSNFVQMLEFENYTTYTFQVFDDDLNDELLRNYVLVDYKDGNFTQLLVHYTKQGEGFDFDSTIIEIIEDDSLLKNIECNNGSASYVALVQPVCVEYTCHGSTGNGTHYPGEDCSASGGDQAYTVCTGGGWFVLPCPPNGTGGGGGTGGGTGTGSGGTNPGGGNSTTILLLPYNHDPLGLNPDPCGHITALLQDTTFKAKLALLNNPTALGLNYEKRFVMSDNNSSETLYEVKNGTPGTSGINFRTNAEGTLTGMIHVHYNGPNMSPVFTLEDVQSFYNIYHRRILAGNPLESLTMMVVSHAGVYALVIDDYDFLFKATGLVSNFDKMFDKFNENNDQINTVGKAEKNLLKNISSFGISLYKANDNLTGWNKLSLNSAGAVQPPTPCN